MRTTNTGALLVFMALFVATFGWVNVHPTEVAVEVNKVAGKINPEPRGVGYHFFNRWITDMVVYKADAEGKRLQAEALGGGKNVVALKFAESLPPTFKTFVVPVGQNTTSLMDINGLTKGLFTDEKE